MTITCVNTGRTLGVRRSGADLVYLEIEEPEGRRKNAIVPRPEFLAAVAAETDSIIIPRSELPEVEDDDVADHYTVKATSTWPNREMTHSAAGDVRERALRHLALAEHLDAHPPVDEAQVQVLANILGDFAVADEHTGERDDRTLARRLVERGVTVKEES